MLKRLSVALAALLVLSGTAFGAGTLPGFSLSQQMGSDGKPLSGCVLKIIQAGTVATPQIAYQDSGLTIPVPGGSQLTCDAKGRIGQFFLADGSIKIALFDRLGNTQVTADGLLVVGASSGGGGGSPVDPTTIAATGDLKHAYGTQILTGWVRQNGRTIGNAASGATERANADTNALFLYLWATDANLVVSGGRTTAAADYAANKTIALPDMRGRALSGLDDMGNSAAGRLTATYFGATGGCSGVLGTTLGAACGSESQLLTLAQTPTGITSSNASQAITVTSGVNNIAGTPGNIQPSANFGGSGSLPTPTSTLSWLNVTSFSGNNAIAVTSNNTGGLAHPQVDPRILVTIYMKL